MRTAPSWLDRSMLRALRRLAGPAPVSFALPGCAEEAPSDALVPIIRFDSRRTLARVLLNPEIGFGDAYAAGTVRIEGPLGKVVEALYHSAQARTWYSRLASFLLTRQQRNSLDGSRRNIHHHYDIPTDFYQLWLDPKLVYTCAYFSDRDMTLEEAQAAKHDHVCRKLMLRRGETVVEAGCGWGSLALHMARHYGVQVKAFNISHEQIECARAAAQREGLSGQVEFIEDDYRNIQGRFDALVSLGMLEHVGTAHYRDFGRMIDRCLSPTGRGLIQSIGQDWPDETNPWIERRIFPGTYPPTLREMMDIFEPPRLSILDVENLRLHYAETLRHWLKRFEASAGAVAAMFDERFVRTWRLYLAGSCAAFTAGALQLFQVVFSRPGINDIPRTRARLYS
jgi:cyclopropane-fatty-acyl-phospholipid synthase